MSGAAERRAFLAAAVTAALWSSSFTGIRVALLDYSPYHLSLIRFVTASAVFLIYAAAVRMPRPERKDWPYLAFLGFFGISLYHTLLNLGEQTVPAGTASLIIATVPVMTAALSRWMLKEELSGLGWFGLILSLAGIAVMTLGGGDGAGYASGIFLVFLSAIACTVYFVYTKPMLAKYRPIHLTAYVTWAGTLPLLLFAPGIVEAVRAASLVATASAVYIGVFPAAIAYAAWSVALASLPAGRVASFLYLVPPLAILAGWLYLGELPGRAEGVGGAIALIGVLIVQTRGKPRPLSAPGPGQPPPKRFPAGPGAPR